MLEMDWTYSFAGFVVGAMVGMTGVGGGAMMTPVLVLIFGVPPAMAVGTDLWFAALTKTVGGFMHNKSGSVDWQVLRLLCLGSLPASILTIAWLQTAGIGQVNQGLILTGLGLVLVLTAVTIVFKKKAQALGTAVRTLAPAQFKKAQPLLTVIAGSILGVLVTLTSVGAGALGVVMLVYLYPFRMKPACLVGTDIVHAIPLTIIAGMGHLWMNNVDFLLLGKLLLGSVPGIILGSMISTKAPETLLRFALAVILSVAGLKLLLDQTTAL